jgi:hypothetical protein
VTSFERADGWLLAAMMVALCCASPLHLALNNPNEGVRVFMVAAMVEDHRLSIDQVVERWGYIDDKARFAGRSGR